MGMQGKRIVCWGKGKKGRCWIRKGKRKRVFRMEGAGKRRLEDLEEGNEVKEIAKGGGKGRVKRWTAIRRKV